MFVIHLYVSIHLSQPQPPPTTPRRDVPAWQVRQPDPPPVPTPPRPADDTHTHTHTHGEGNYER